MKRNEVIRHLYNRAEPKEQVAIDGYMQWFFHRGFKFVRIKRPMTDASYKVYHTHDSEYNEINHKIELKIMERDMTRAHAIITELHEAGTLKEFNAILRREGVK